MKTRDALLLMLALMLVSGVDAVRSMDQPIAMSGWTLLSSVLFSFLTFAWYRIDSEQRGYRRTPLLNVGIIAFAPVAAPYYLVRSRPAGQKARAVLGMVGFCLLLMLAGFTGGIAYTVFGATA